VEFSQTVECLGVNNGSCDSRRSRVSLGADTDTVSRRPKRKNEENGKLGKRKNEENRPPLAIDGEDTHVVPSVTNRTRSRGDINSESSVTKGNSAYASFILQPLISVQY
jgi:hypothetical protein